MAIERLCRLDVCTIYFGLDETPLISGANEVLAEMLRNLQKANAQNKG